MQPRRSRRRAAGKAETHQRIVRSASRLVRRKGITRTGVQEVMHDAGLTVGGFYAHFQSKQAMDLEVLEATFAEVRARNDARLGSLTGIDRVAEAVGHYLSRAHRDTAEDGCPAPAVVADLLHGDPQLQAALGRFFDRWCERLAAHLPEPRPVDRRARALATIALCVGGLTIARTLKGQAIGDEFLAAAQAFAVPERRTRRRRRITA